MKELDIGTVARWSGLPASTLRYYEEKGLIRSIGRNGLRRVFAESVLQRLSLIALGRTAGFSLEDIAGMLASEGGPAENHLACPTFQRLMTLASRQASRSRATAR
ncbi:MerR family transcriptional regulator [Ectopseudomonas khazarica]|uniref:MerR family transcriptional regulator n=1 Tax=Ectopseudomonas khazarica TaxID=2502979 RepID=UPI003850091C